MSRIYKNYFFVGCQVFEFFKKRIELQYPIHQDHLDPLVIVKESHESFLENKADGVLGRINILQEVMMTAIKQHMCVHVLGQLMTTANNVVVHVILRIE